jgi:hypothetical protein
MRYVQFYAKGRSQPEIGGSDMANPKQTKVSLLFHFNSVVDQSILKATLIIIIALYRIQYNKYHGQSTSHEGKIACACALIQTGKCLLSPEQRKRRNVRNVDCYRDATAALSRERRFCWRYPTLSNYSPCKNRRKSTMIRLASSSVAKHLSLKLRSGRAPPLFVSYVCSAPPLHTALEPNASRKELSTFIWNVLG